MQPHSNKAKTTEIPESSRPRPTREVFLLFNRSNGADREILRGIFEAAYPGNRWLFFFGKQDVSSLQMIAKSEGVSGVIGKFGSADLAKAASKLRIPVINVHGGTPLSGLSQVGVDRYRQGKFAAEWFIKQGLPNFGFFGLEGEAFSEPQQKGFSERLKADAKAVHTWTPTVHEKDIVRIGAPSRAVRWLSKLPKPIAIYCANDVLANELSMFCLQAQLSVPQDVVILASDNDDLLCGGSLPTLSSIRLPYRQVGRRAAELLEQQMTNPTQGSHTELIDQPDIIERQSTLFKHVEDPIVEKALQWMSDHATHGIDLESAARITGVSLRALEFRFKKALNQTPRDEFNRIRLEAVKKMLREQDTTLEEIAEACSFSSGIYLNQFFRREAGMTPGMYRRIFRKRGHL